MSIEKMKKLRLMAVSSQRKDILRELMLLGCVEFSEPPADPDDEIISRLTRADGLDVQKLKSRQGDLITAVRLLDRYAPEKKKLLSPLPQVELEQLLDESRLDEDLELARKLIGIDDEIRRITGEESRIRSEKESLTPWLSLDLPPAFAGTATTAVFTASLPAAVEDGAPENALADAGVKAQLFRVSEDEALKYVLLVCYREDTEEAVNALRPFGYSAISVGGAEETAAESFAASEKKLEELAAEKEKLIGQIAQEAPHRGELKLRSDTIGTEIDRAEAASSLLCTGSTFVMQGWLMASKEEQLKEVLSRYDCAWETEDPDPGHPEEVPVKLRSNFLTRPYNLITEMYSLPAYNGLDPNPFIMPGFALFFGIMFADMAYGLIMVIAGLLITYKARPRGGMKYLAGLAVQCGISTFIMGFFTGSFFGDAFSIVGSIFDKSWTLVPTFGAINIGSISVALPLTLLEGNNPLYVLVAAMCIGVVHLAVGTGLGVYLKLRDGQWIDAIFNDLSWWVILVGIALMALGMGNTVLYVGIDRKSVV